MRIKLIGTGLNSLAQLVTYNITVKLLGTELNSLTTYCYIAKHEYYIF